MRANRALRLVLTVTIAAIPQVAIARAQTLIPPKPRVHASPYSKLFAVPDLKATTSTPPTLESVGDLEAPTVKCGTKLIPIDPSIDHGIYLQPKRGDTRYTIRAVPPRVCR